MTSSIKPEIHNIFATPPEEDRVTPTGSIHKNMVKIVCVVPKICPPTDRQTDRHGHHNTPLPYQWRSNKSQTVTRSVFILQTDDRKDIMARRKLF